MFNRLSIAGMKAFLMSKLQSNVVATETGVKFSNGYYGRGYSAGTRQRKSRKRAAQVRGGRKS